MNYIPLLTLLACLWMSAVLVKGLVFEYKLRSPILLVYVATFVMFLIPTLLDSIEGGEYPSWVYLEASFFGALYVTLFLASRLFFTSLLGTRSTWLVAFNEARQAQAPREALFVFIFCAVVAFSSLIVGLDITSLQKAFLMNWWDLVHAESPLVLFGTYMTYCSAPLVVFGYAGRKAFPRTAFLALLISVLFVVFAIFVLKTRSYVLVFLVPIFLYLFYKKGLLKSVPLALYGAAIMFLFVLTRAVRHAENLNEFMDAGLDQYFGDAANGAEVEYVQALFYYIYHHNSFPGFGENITLQRIVFFWVPKFTGWVKPYDFSYYMFSAYFGDPVYYNYSMHPTLIGDAYGNAGFLGAFIYSVALSFYFTAIEKAQKLWGNPEFTLAAFSIVSVNCLTFSRGAVYNAFMFSLLTLIIVAVLISVFRKLSLLRLRIY